MAALSFPRLSASVRLSDDRARSFFWNIWCQYWRLASKPPLIAPGAASDSHAAALSQQRGGGARRGLPTVATVSSLPCVKTTTLRRSALSLGRFRVFLAISAMSSVCEKQAACEGVTRGVWQLIKGHRCDGGRS